VLSAAINKAGSTEPDKIRAAILATRGYKGAEGEYNFNEFGDGLHGYNIVRNEKGAIVFDRHRDSPSWMALRAKSCARFPRRRGRADAGDWRRDRSRSP
jgi:hypothetical protein